MSGAVYYDDLTSSKQIMLTCEDVPGLLRGFWGFWGGGGERFLPCTAAGAKHKGLDFAGRAWPTTCTLVSWNLIRHSSG